MVLWKNFANLLDFFGAISFWMECVGDPKAKTIIQSILTVNCSLLKSKLRLRISKGNSGLYVVFLSEEFIQRDSDVPCLVVAL